MAIYEPNQGRIVVRIAYDGSARSGKTTNVERICASFGNSRRGELIVPEASDGRTQYFDWLRIDGGIVGGFPLRCQIVTVPGQESLRRRRETILKSADAVVFVVDSTPEGILDATTAYSSLHAFQDWWSVSEDAFTHPPVIVQANKQDLKDAHRGEVIRDMLGVPDEVPVVEAQAHEGLGIRETLFQAIHAAAERVTGQIQEKGIDALEGVPQDPAQLYSALKALDEISDPMRVSQALPTSGARARRTTGLSGTQPGGLSSEAPSDGARQTGRSSAEALPEVGFPDPHVPTGYIWPGVQGRQLLRRVQKHAPQYRRDLSDAFTRASPGAPQALLYEVGPWLIQTTTTLRYSDAKIARSVLLKKAQQRVALESMLPDNIVLALSPDAHGNLWLWTASPLVDSLHTIMIRADRDGDEQELQRGLESYADASVSALMLFLRRKLVLHLDPHSFAMNPKGAVYVDDEVRQGPEAQLLGPAILKRIHEFEHRPRSIRRYLSRLETNLMTQFNQEERNRLNVRASIENAPAATKAVREAQLQLLQRLPAGV